MVIKGVMVGGSLTSKIKNMVINDQGKNFCFSKNTITVVIKPKKQK
jgi:hypothetical protein